MKIKPTLSIKMSAIQWTTNDECVQTHLFVHNDHNGLWKTHRI